MREGRGVKELALNMRQKEIGPTTCLCRMAYLNNVAGNVNYFLLTF